jgi:hypothetical protein
MMRLWLSWNETWFYAGVTIALRSARLTTKMLTGGTLPANECLRMIGEKQIAAVEAMTGTWLALPEADAVGLAAAALKPYRCHTRANARRLSRRGKR